MFDNVLDAARNTPLIRLIRLPGPDDAEVLVKFEAMNAGGSIKTRTAVRMLEDAKARGLLDENTLVVEPTSGNQGIGLALAGAVLGVRVHILMPDSVSEERRLMMEHYGAIVQLVHDEGDIGACMEECMAIAESMKQNDPHVFVPQQFENPANPAVQREETAAEILRDAPGLIDGFCSGIGTGGTISGIGSALKEANPDIVIWAVEPENAAILAGGSVGTHVQMGIGDGIIPKNLDQTIYEGVAIISDEEAVRTARELARKEGLACGISGGTNVAAALRMAKELGPGKRVVTILPDLAERYFSTPLFAH